MVGGHPHGYSGALLRRDCGDDLLCLDQRRIFGVRLVPSGSRLKMAEGVGKRAVEAARDADRLVVAHGRLRWPAMAR